MADNTLAAGLGVSIAGGVLGGLMRRKQREQKEEQDTLANELTMATAALSKFQADNNPAGANMVMKWILASKSLVGNKGVKQQIQSFAPLMEALQKGNVDEVSGAGAVKTDVNRVQTAVQSHEGPTQTPTPMAPSPNATPERPPLFQTPEAMDTAEAERQRKSEEAKERGAQIMSQRLNIPIESARARMKVTPSPIEKKPPTEGTLGSYILQKVSDAEADKGGELTEPERIKAVENARQDWAKYGRAPKAALDTLPPQLKERVSELLGKQKIVNPTEEDIKGVIEQASTELRQEAATKNQAVIVRINSGQGSDEDNADVADQLVRGNLIPSMLSKRTGNYNKVLAEADKRSMELTGKHYNAVQAQLNYSGATRFIASMNGQQMVRFRGLADSVVNTIEEVRSLGEQLKQGGVQKWNSAKRNTILQVYGNTEQSDTAARYIGAINTLKEEFANLAQGGYAPTEAAWTLANGQINSDYGVKDLEASLSEVQTLINFRMDAFDKQAPFKVTGSEDPKANTPGPFSKSGGNSPGPRVGEERMFDGKRARWDGKGWMEVK